MRGCYPPLYMTYLLMGTVCPNRLCDALVVPLLHKGRYLVERESWEMECPFCGEVFQVSDRALESHTVTTGWIEKACYERDARLKGSV